MSDKENDWVRLDSLGFIRASGPDTATFLQGQFSSDVRLLNEMQAQISSYNSPKGRMLAVLHLYRHGDAVMLELHRSVLDYVLKRLRLYVLRSKVVLDDVSASYGALGLMTAKPGLPCPAEPLAAQTVNGLRVIRRLGSKLRWSVHGDRATLATLAANPTENDTSWRSADIEAGVPTIYPQTQDRFVPQWCNLDRLGGISFDKGCYTGQEIVARVHYLGEVKRRMRTVELDATAEPGSETAQGEVVDCAPTSDGRCKALMMQKI